MCVCVCVSASVLFVCSGCVGIRQSVCVRGKRLNKREERDQQTANTRERKRGRKGGGGERDGEEGSRERRGESEQVSDEARER